MERETGTITEERERVQAVRREEEKGMKGARMAATGGSAGEAIGGAAAIVLGILGLIGVFPFILVSAATIAIGAALMLGGGSLAARFQAMAAAEGRVATTGGGMAMLVLSGLGGVVLGILAVLGLVTMTLVPIAIIAFGASLALSGLSSAGASMAYRGQQSFLAGEAEAAASGTEVMVGLAGIVLGIIALAGLYPVILSLISVLAIGGAIVMRATSVAGVMLGSVSR